MDKWQTMRTAPKDGTLILAVWPNDALGVVWFEDGEWHEYDDTVIVDNMTHWMPLPAPPVK